MSERRTLISLADKLLDTGKRNNLINFKDTKTSTAEVLIPDCETLFGKCAVGRVFEVFDPGMPDTDEQEINADASGNASGEEKTNRESYKTIYSRRLKKESQLLVYSQLPDPGAAVRSIAKKSQEMQNETGINVAYLAFGFLKWNEKERPDVFFRAPLLLVHINILIGSIADPIRLEVSDDDVIVNPTFRYLLKAEHGLSLPDFEDGDTLSSYYAKVETAVAKTGWKVLDECRLGIFSFLKINMYEDLKTNFQKILSNKNIRALLGESIEEAADNDGSRSYKLQNPLIELHTVVDADSSQIEAIEMAKSGKSFVLQGPPGTGKSQTITNIIAECLHDGKKILFVSEKQAALNVVFDKLKKAGLEDFCLELHSHKANKKAVIDELNETLETKKSSVSSNAEDEIRRKSEAQQKLDSYAEELHKERETIKMPLYQLFELYSAQRAYPDINYTIRNIQTKGCEHIAQAIRLLDQYSEFVPSVGEDYRKNCWYGFTNDRISYEGRVALKTDIERLLNGYQNLRYTTARIKEKYETPELNFSDTKKWQSLLAFSAASDVVTPSLLSGEALEYAYPYLEQMKENSAVIVPLRDSLLESCTPEVIREQNGRDVYTKLTGQYSSFFSRLFSGEYKNIIAGLRLYRKDKRKLNYTQAVELAEKLMQLQTALGAFEESAKPVSGCLGRCYKGPDTDWAHVMSDLETLRGYFSDRNTSFCSISKMDAQSFAQSKTAFKDDSDKLDSEMDQIMDVKKRVSAQFAQSALDLDNYSYEFCIKKLEGCLNEFDKLGNWIGFMALLEKMSAADLTAYTVAAITARVDPTMVTDVYKKLFYKQWIENIIFSVPVLASFTRIRQDQAVLDFGKKDSLQYEISKLQIRSELSHKRPNLEMTAGGSAVAILRREGQKKRKQMPIRRLLSETGSLVQIIKPCFLMSPLSVSTFLDPEKISFDTVIFDEASQIFPQDAVGAIYRGKQLIVVGDSRQMPPSNFFSTTIDDDDDEAGDVNDFESILDAYSSVFTQERLRWHYRSHYEQLIAFSNLNFYNNNLITFPSSSRDHEGIGVDFCFAGGVFDRTSKTNRTEAELIVELIYRHIQEYPKRSLGVVAFSAAQQNLIDRLLSKRREADHSFEWFFKSDNSEPFFIKNLETVQGDERDTIIFSVAYAKDAQGRFIQNFGPLNREGGERRLNVAVTRAKDNVKLVSSIRYTDIDLTSTASEGVRLLRAYLDYAENGEQALDRAITVSDENSFDSFLEQEVCDFLRENGYTVDTQVGCSGYRIDLGVRIPESSNYLLAIECDGATYHSSRNARDRDCLRQRVLENMGWQFYRIWSTDWYKNKAIEKERLLQVVKDAFAKAEAPREETPSEAADETSAAKEAEERFETEAADSRFVFPVYHQLDAMRIMQKHQGSFLSGIKEILKTEAPLSEEFLLKRIVLLFGREKITSVVQSEYERKMEKCEQNGIIRRDGFLYIEGAQPVSFRVPGDRREIKYISIEELAAGLKILIEQNVTATREGIYRAVSNLLGYSRTGDAIAARSEAALELLKNRGVIKEADGMLSLCEENQQNINS